MHAPVDTLLAELFALQRAGRAPEAEAACRAAIAQSPHLAVLHAVLGRLHLAAGRLPEARAALAQALAIDPDERLALLEDATLARRERDLPRALGNLRRLVARWPQEAVFAATHAQVLLAAGDLSAARAESARALALDPRHPEARMTEADLAHAGGDFAGALARWQALANDLPQAQRAWLGVARSAERLGDLPLAAQACGRALGLDDRNPEALRAFARLALALKDLPGTLRAARRLLQVQPDAADAWYTIAIAQWQENAVAEAREALRELLARHPGHLPGRWLEACLPQDVVHADAAAAEAFARAFEDALVRFEALDPDDPRQQTALKAALTLATDFHVWYARSDVLPLRRRVGALLRRCALAIDGDPTPAPRPARARPRVLFVSAFLYEHSVTKLFERVLTGLDRTRIEPRYLHAEDLHDDCSARLQAASDGFRHGVRALDALRAAILDEQPDVLCYLDVGMDAPLQWLAAQRLAPVQVALWGHPITTGLPTVDWFLTADAMEREGGEADYVERVFRLPGLGCRFAPPGSATPDPAFVPPPLPPGGVRYGLMQTAFKVTPVHDGVLARIADANPGARFELTPGPKPSPRARLEARLGAAGPIAFTAHPRLSRAQWLALAAALDVNLDPIGWSGGVSTLETLWFDVPTVTLPGRSMRSRHTLGMLRVLELDHRLAARDLDDYVRIAVDLGRSPDLRAELRGLIGERKHRLYDDARVSRALEDFLLEVAAGRAPRPAAP